MRDPKRIPIIMQKIQEQWELNPDFRLGQLICVFTRPSEPSNDIFNIEEADLVKGIETFSNRHQINNSVQRRNYWEKYPNICKPNIEELNIELIESFIATLKENQEEITITPKNLMKLNYAPVNDKSWMARQKDRINVIKNILMEIERKNIIREIEIGYEII